MMEWNAIRFCFVLTFQIITVTFALNYFRRRLDARVAVVVLPG